MFIKEDIFKLQINN